MLKKTIIFVALCFIVSSCGGSWDEVKRGLSGKKEHSTDEFLIRKKDPLILPPDFDSLPAPENPKEIKEEISSLEKTLGKTSSSDSNSPSRTQLEESILEKIRSK